MKCELEPASKEHKAKGVRDVPSKKEVMLKAALEIDNFMLDGFDFSTGIEIELCCSIIMYMHMPVSHMIRVVTVCCLFYLFKF